MVWVKLDDRFPEHPKIESLSDPAFRAHVRALCYCGRNETGGLIPKNAADALARSEPVLAELLQARVWESENGHLTIHDYGKYNPSKEQIDARRKARAERIAAWRARQRNADGNAVTNAVRNVPPVPDPDPPLRRGEGSEARTPPPKGGRRAPPPYSNDDLQRDLYALVKDPSVARFLANCVPHQALVTATQARIESGETRNHIKPLLEHADFDDLKDCLSAISEFEQEFPNAKLHRVREIAKLVFRT